MEDLRRPRDHDGWLLRLAVDANRIDAVQALLEAGFDPDARVRVEDECDTWGMPLYACVRGHQHEIAELLLKHGADPNGQVYASGTPLSEAYGQRDEKMIGLLVQYGGKPNASMAGLYRRMDLALELLERHGDEVLPDDGFSKGTVAEQLLGAAAKGGDPAILRLAIERVSIPDGDRRWNGLLKAPLQFWNHWYGPWCHLEWDRGSYLECFRLILEKSGPPNHQFQHGLCVLHEIVKMGDHVRPDERVAFAEAAIGAGARRDLREELFNATPGELARQMGRTELVAVLDVT